MTLPICDPSQFQLGRRKQSYSREEMTELEKEAERIAAFHESHAQQFEDYHAQRQANIAKTVSMNDLAYHKSLGELETLKPGNSDKVADMLATQFNQKAANLATNPSAYSTSGNVWYQLQQSRRIASGMVDAMARWRGAPAVRDVVKEIRSQFGKIPISRQEINELIQRGIEVGQIPERRASYMVGEAGDAFNMARHHQFVDNLQAKGLGQQQVDNILAAVGKIQANADEARIAAASFNPKLLETPEGLAGWARQFSPDAKRFLARVQKTEDLHDALTGGKEAPIDLKQMVIKDRYTYHYIPESEALLAYQLGISPEELRTQIIDGKQFIDTLHSLKPEELDNLVDNGSLSKIPMTTPEVFHYLVGQYGELPFKGMKEMFLTDPVNVFNHYREQLARDAGRSAQVTTFFNEGIKHGWVVDKDTVEANPDAYKDFTKLDADSVRRVVPDFSGGEEAVYVHPTAWNMLKTQVNIAKSPAMLATMASSYAAVVKTFMGLVKTTNNSLILNPIYPMRIFHANFVSAASAGANLLRIPEGFRDLAAIQLKGVEALDDTKAIYEVAPGQLVTKRQLFTDYFVRNRSSDILPQTQVIKTAKVDINAIDPRNLPRAIGYLKAYASMYGGAHALEYLGDMFSKAQHELFSPIGSFAMYKENAMKWTTMLSLTDSRPSSRIGQFASTLQAPHIGDFAKTLKYVDDYFHTWDDVGQVTKFTTNYLRPFAQFAMNNPMMQVRAALRKPTMFMNYWRIRSLINQRAANDPDFNESDVPKYMRDSGALYLFKIDDQWVSLPTSGSDPIFEGFNFFRNLSEDTQHYATGEPTGDSHKRLEQLKSRLLEKKAPWQEMMAGVLKETQPLFQEALSQESGVDTKTGYNVNRPLGSVDPTFLGLDMPPAVVHLLKTYGALNKLDQWNPGNVFGTPEARDANTGKVIQPGQPGIFGSQRNSNTQPEIYSTKNQGDWRLQVLRMAGFQPKIFDYAKQTQYNFSDIQAVKKDAKAAINRSIRNINRTDISDTQKDHLRDALNESITAYASLSLDEERVHEYMKRMDIKPADALRRAERTNLANLQLKQEAVKRVQDETAAMRKQAGLKGFYTDTRQREDIENVVPPNINYDPSGDNQDGQQP